MANNPKKDCYTLCYYNLEIMGKKYASSETKIIFDTKREADELVKYIKDNDTKPSYRNVTAVEGYPKIGQVNIWEPKSYFGDDMVFAANTDSYENLVFNCMVNDVEYHKKYFVYYYKPTYLKKKEVYEHFLKGDMYHYYDTFSDALFSASQIGLTNPKFRYVKVYVARLGDPFNYIDPERKLMLDSDDDDEFDELFKIINKDYVNNGSISV